MNYAYLPYHPTTLAIQLPNQVVYHHALPPHFGAWHQRPLPQARGTHYSTFCRLVDIDPRKQYTVEWRHEFSVNRTQTLSGGALARLTITLEAVSQSVLVMYKAQ